MKLAVLLLSAILWSTPRTEELDADFREFAALVPLDKIADLTNEYMEYQEFVNVMDYMLNGQEVRDLTLEGEQIPEYLALLDYLQESGADVYDYINLVHDFLELEPLQPPKPRIVRRSPASQRQILNDFRNDIRAILPKDEIDALHQKKIVSSPAFKFFSDRVRDPAFDALIQDLIVNDTYRKIHKMLLNGGVDIVDAAIFYAQVLGFIDF